MKSFEELAQIDVGQFVEKKGRFNYLSWADAANYLLVNDPKATWSYGEPQHWGETVIIFCTVTAFEKSMTAQLPVMDNKNKPIVKPSAFDVNTAMQRCLTKAIALHGIGLYIYRGEDLPTIDEGGQQSEPHEMLNWSVDFLNRISNCNSPDELTALIAENDGAINDCTPSMVKSFKDMIAKKSNDTFHWPKHLIGK